MKCGRSASCWPLHKLTSMSGTGARSELAGLGTELFTALLTGLRPWL